MKFCSFYSHSVIVAVAINLCSLTPHPQSADAAVGDEHWDTRFGLPGVTNGVYSLLSDAGRVYAGGLNQAVLGTNGVHVWDGQSWNSLPGTFSSGSFVVEYAVAKQNSNIYVGGVFSSINGQSMRNLARWDGSSWWQVGGGDIMTACRGEKKFQDDGWSKKILGEIFRVRPKFFLASRSSGL